MSGRRGLAVALVLGPGVSSWQTRRLNSLKRVNSLSCDIPVTLGSVTPVGGIRIASIELRNQSINGLSGDSGSILSVTVGRGRRLGRVGALTVRISSVSAAYVC